MHNKWKRFVMQSRQGRTYTHWIIQADENIIHHRRGVIDRRESHAP